ncbi:MAG: 23S rRNA (guanosine(2251)-2'-O)-methyltransferase RlmB [Pseudomonadales bacterium]
MIYGVHSVSAWLRARGSEASRLLVREGKLSARLEDVTQLASACDCPVDRVTVEMLDRLGGKAHQGVVLYIENMEALNEDALAPILEDRHHKLLLLVLDGVTDPRNLGACLRSAATMGVDAVISPRHRSAPLNSAALKTASGGAAQVPVIDVVNLARTLERLKREGVWIIGTVADSAEPLAGVDMTTDIALVMGAEDKGIRPNTRKHCDVLANIPMVNAEPGFNVSVAAGICLYEVYRQRIRAE